MKLSHLLAELPRYQIESALTDDPDITAITADSRQVKPGSLFVAYDGAALDGHQFIPQAIDRGAVAVVCEKTRQYPTSKEREAYQDVPQPLVILVPNGREALAYFSAAWHDHPARALTMVGITGTDGKTTTTNLLYQILKAAQKPTSMVSTVNAVIGGMASETGLHTTTPDAPLVQQYLRQMVQAGSETCLLEVTSHGLAHHRVTGCEFDVAIVTNITHEHLDAHENSLENYRAAKAMLFESLATAHQKGRSKMAVLNCDDWSFGYLKAKLEQHGTAWQGYSLSDHPEASLIAERIISESHQTSFTVRNIKSEQTFIVQTNLVGDYNVSNCLAAITAAQVGFGLPADLIQRGIAALTGIPGRMERIDEGQPFMAIVDFAHTPNSLRRSLQVARTLTTGRVIAVFGCAGLRDVEKRVMMGHIAAELADMSIITAEDPRTEALADIISTTANVMLADGAIEGQTFERIPDRGRAIYRATQLAQTGDVVIALGKGHEQSMCFGQTEYAWDDRAAMRAALRGTPMLTLPTATDL